MSHQPPPRLPERADENPRSLDREIHLPPDEAFAVLRNDRRRAVIAFLAGETGARSVDAVTRAVAASEHDVPPEHVTERQRKGIYVSLLQIHLPKLVEVGVIEWDERAGTIEGTRSVGALAGVVGLVERVCGSDER